MKNNEFKGDKTEKEVAKKKKEIFIKTNIVLVDSPKVKYRGIFINDEAPAFSGWTKEKFGGVNHQVYEKVFELILRLKGNYLWPAMWGNAFNDDDTLNPVLANKWGIVMGTSHHEPMLRAQQEWRGLRSPVCARRRRRRSEQQLARGRVVAAHA